MIMNRLRNLRRFYWRPRKVLPITVALALLATCMVVYRKTAQEEVAAATIKTCAVYGADGSYDSDGERVPGARWPGYFSSVEGCARACERTAACDGFHYYGQKERDAGTRGHCYMKRGVTKVDGPLNDGRDRYAGRCGGDAVHTAQHSTSASQTVDAAIAAATDAAAAFDDATAAAAAAVDDDDDDDGGAAAAPSIALAPRTDAKKARAVDTAEIKEPAAVTATASSADKTTPATPDKKVCKVVGPSRNIESEHKQATDDWPLHGVVSATACAHECEEEESCTAIHYYSDTLACYLHGERKPILSGALDDGRPRYASVCTGKALRDRPPPLPHGFATLAKGTPQGVLTAGSKLPSAMEGVARSIIARHGFVYLLFFDQAYLAMTKSWICNVRPLGNVLPNLILVATGKAAADALRAMDDSLHVFEQQYQAMGEVKYGTYAYFRLTVERLRLQNELLQAGLSVMIVEADAVWLPHATVVGADVRAVLQTNDMVTYNDCGGGEGCVAAGFLAIVSNKYTRDFFQKYYDQYSKSLLKFNGIKDVGEQLTMTRLLRRDRHIEMQWLDPKKYCSGKYYIGNHAGEWDKPAWHVPSMYHSDSCVVIQNNWITGNGAKVRRAKAHKHWYLDDGGAACT